MSLTHPYLLTNTCVLFLLILQASMVMPPSRNAIDSTLPQWHNVNNSQPPETGSIEPYNCRCTNSSEPYCNSGQGCFWFSQGCTIGCSKCDGLGARLPHYDHCPLESIKPTVNDPKYRSMNQNATAGSVRRLSFVVCCLLFAVVVVPWKERSFPQLFHVVDVVLLLLLLLLVVAVHLQVQDIFYFNPWRAPGRAPVFDPCGKAGGSDHEAFNAGAYNETRFAKQGDLGSVVLKPRPTGTVWKRGATEKARWQYTASHGGGYQFRLCPANSPLTEACFKKMPLKFAAPNGHTVLFANHSVRIASTLVPDSITGTGDWMLNPIPSRDSDYVSCDKVMPKDEHCPWKCAKCGAPWYAADSACPCKCAESYPGKLRNDHCLLSSGIILSIIYHIYTHHSCMSCIHVMYSCSYFPQNQHFPTTEYFPSGHAYVGADKQIFPDPLPNIENYHAFVIEDELVVPTDIDAGDYVLGWRWDCEQTTQIWSTCSDITIV